MDVENVPPAAATSNQNDKEELENFIKSQIQRRDQKLELKSKNSEASANRPDETALRKLDSNLKKNTAFVKKVKIFTESQKAAILKDFDSLNLSKYVAELAVSVGEAKLKSSDVPGMVELCSRIHQRYAEFSQNLLDSYFKKVFPKRKDDQIQNLAKFRVDLRLLADLVAVGVFAAREALPILGAALNFMAQNDKEVEHPFLPVLTSFCKSCGDDYANFVPTRYKILAKKFGVDLPTNLSLFSVDRQKVIANLFKDYYGKLNCDLLTMYKETKRLERRVQRQYDTKGEIHPELRQHFDEAKVSMTKFHSNVCCLADLIDQPPPNLQIDEKSLDDLLDDVQNEQTESGFIVGGLMSTLNADGGLWEDIETRTFYETLPELRSILPGILFKESEKVTLPPLIDKVLEEDESLVSDQISGQSATTSKSTDQSETTSSLTIDQSQPIDLMETIEELAEDSESICAANAEEEPDEATEADQQTEGNATLKEKMDVFVAELLTLVNRDLIDRAAVDFVTNLNNKINRNRLLKALFNVHRSRQDLLPFYSRLLAILQPVMPDLATELVQMLISDFRRRVRKKDQLYLEEKVKCVRFLGELVKFKLCPKSEALHCLKMLLFDFRYHMVDMACALLDSCGYFLYHSKDSHQRTKILLEQMLRKRQTASNLDQRYQLMVDNAYFTCIPPLAGLSARIERPPMQQYIRKMLFEDLTEDSIERVLKQLRKLDWEDGAVASYAVECLSQPWLAKFSDVQWIASLLAGITWYYDFVGHRVVDNILEDVRLGMEINHHKFNQRRLCCVKYLGEMYNYRVVDSTIIFNLLYCFVTFGVNYDVKVPGSLDPPEHLFRIRLACVCLDTCGEYFDRGLSGKKLDIFFTYLQRYFWWKKAAGFWNESERPFPVEVENLLSETIEFLRPKLKPFESLEEATLAVSAIEQEYRAKLESALKSPNFLENFDQCHEMDEDEDKRHVLRPIQEEDDEDYAPTLGGQLKNRAADRESTGRGRLDKEDEGAGGFSGNNGNDPADLMDQEVHVKMHENSVDYDALAYENDLFNAEFDKFLGECISNRAHEQLKVPQPEFGVPVMSKTKKHARFDLEDKAEAGEAQPANSKEDENKVDFVLMMKGKSNKVALKTVKVPLDSDLARALKDREISELAEKQRVKQLTLNMTRRMQEEELAEVERAQSIEKERIRQHQNVYSSILLKR